MDIGLLYTRVKKVHRFGLRKRQNEHRLALHKGKKDIGLGYTRINTDIAFGLDNCQNEYRLWFDENQNGRHRFSLQRKPKSLGFRFCLKFWGGELSLFPLLSYYSHNVSFVVPSSL